MDRELKKLDFTVLPSQTIVICKIKSPCGCGALSEAEATGNSDTLVRFGTDSRICAHHNWYKRTDGGIDCRIAPYFGVIKGGIQMRHALIERNTKETQLAGTGTGRCGKGRDFHRLWIS